MFYTIRLFFFGFKCDKSFSVVQCKARMATSAFAYEATKGIHEADKLANTFFSQANIDALQHGIRFRVYRDSGGKHVIDKQSEDELRIIMRSIYLENAVHRPFMIVEEVRRLNALVLDFCVPRILIEIDMYVRYLHDSTTMPIYMNRPENTSVKGNNSLEMNMY